MSIVKQTVKVPIGARYALWAAQASSSGGADGHPAYGPIRSLGENVKAYLTKTYASGDIFGDDVAQLHDEAFISAQLDTETTYSDLQLLAELYGRTWTSAEGEASHKDDNPPAGGFGYIEPVLLKSKAVVYRAVFLYNVTAMPSAEKDEADTRKNDFNPRMNAVSFFVAADNTGVWRARMEFSTEASALAWLETQFGSGSYYEVTAAAPGAEDKITGNFGSNYVPSGSAITIGFTGSPVKIYDNGAEVSATSAGKYILSNVSADHTVVFVYSST